MKKIAFSIAVLGIAFVIGQSRSAEAALIANDLNEIEFHDRETGIAADGSAATNLVDNTRLVGVIVSNTLQAPPGTSVGTGGITGVYDVTVNSIMDTSGNTLYSHNGLVYTDATFTHLAGSVTSPLNAYVLFGASGNNGILGTGSFTLPSVNGVASSTFTGLGAGAGAMLEMFNNSNPAVSDSNVDAPSVSSQAAALGVASNGTSIGTFGGGYWVATATYVDGQVDLADYGIDFAFGLNNVTGSTFVPASQLYNPAIGPTVNVSAAVLPSIFANKASGPGLGALAPSALVAANSLTPVAYDIVGGGAADGPYTTPGQIWPIQSHDPAYAFPTPEPSTLTLYGICAAIAVPYLRYRRKRTSI